MSRQATEIDLQAVGGTWGELPLGYAEYRLIVVPDDIEVRYLCYYDKLRILLCVIMLQKCFVDLGDI